MRAFRAIMAAAVLAGSIAIAPAAAAPLVFTYGSVDSSGGTAPSGTPPWLTAVFEDDALSPGTVRLTLAANLQSKGEFVSSATFNFNPKLLVSDLILRGFDVPAGASVAMDNKQGNNGIDGFDFELSFLPESADGFTGDEKYVLVFAYSLPTLHTLTAADFDYESEPDPNSAEAKKKAEEAKKKAAEQEQAEKEQAEKEEAAEKKKAEKDDGLLKALADLEQQSAPRYSLALVQGIGQSGDLSASLVGAPPGNGVPEPGTLALLGIALAGFVAASRRRTRH